MARILILLAHPTLHRSRVNRAMLAAIEDMNGVTVHDLYEAYPDFHISVDAEQARLREHDVVVFQHPFYWYSSPAILKEWQDVVLEKGFAFGAGDTELAGKRFLSAITAGGPEEIYRREGINYFSVRELLAPFEQTVRLCKMRWVPPFVVHDTNSLTREQAAAAGADYRTVLEFLRDDAADLGAVAGRRYINDGPLPAKGAAQ